jgi:hypothetical protein
MIRRAIGILTVTALVSGGGMVLDSRAADSPAVAPTASAPAHPAPAKAAAASPPAAKPPVTKPPAPGAPQVPEESATIRDDPTIVPDPKQSADNNVSFPNDI